MWWGLFSIALPHPFCTLDVFVSVIGACAVAFTLADRLLFNNNVVDNNMRCFHVTAALT